MFARRVSSHVSNHFGLRPVGLLVLRPWPFLSRAWGWGRWKMDIRVPIRMG